MGINMGLLIRGQHSGDPQMVDSVLSVFKKDVFFCPPEKEYPPNKMVLCCRFFVTPQSVSSLFPPSTEW